jgi:hypothetical protein
MRRGYDQVWRAIMWLIKQTAYYAWNINPKKGFRFVFLQICGGKVHIFEGIQNLLNIA